MINLFLPTVGILSFVSLFMLGALFDYRKTHKNKHLLEPGFILIFGGVVTFIEQSIIYEVTSALFVFWVYRKELKKIVTENM